MNKFLKRTQTDFIKFFLQKIFHRLYIVISHFFYFLDFFGIFEAKLTVNFPQFRQNI